jgi:hypothetical protein
MNEVYTVEDLAYKCSDFGELVDKIVERVNLCDVVTYDGVRVDSVSVFAAMQEDDSDLVNEILTSLSPFSPLANKYAMLIDEKTQELAEEAARSYKGKFDV